MMGNVIHFKVRRNEDEREMNQHQKWRISIRTFAWAVLFMVFGKELKGFASFNQALLSTWKHQTPNAEIISKQNLPSVTYGLLHMAKIGGTEINGQLSMHYERVCGNKGYSYDAHQTNLRFNNSGSNTALYRSKDSMPGPRSNRGMVPFKIMEEIGFENCDYVAMEVVYFQW
eukprot:CAMPEP_0194319136 /NCGR_PEP_ID=MMETSP0171-20130528/15628_1 /TAXON_ID=218684 /ORGANISM="Corethron pennatum, Strain L29A3" /LENGTH=171 /DNA_ID=CAMNT_0039076247 /DNA_START=86 /DNA_END=598 /DNA_ORIENTATION=+